MSANEVNACNLVKFCVSKCSHFSVVIWKPYATGLDMKLGLAICKVPPGTTHLLQSMPQLLKVAQHYYALS